MLVSVHDLEGQEASSYLLPLQSSTSSSVAFDPYTCQPGENSSVFSLLEPHMNRTDPIKKLPSAGQKSSLSSSLGSLDFLYKARCSLLTYSKAVESVGAACVNAVSHGR